MMLQAEKYIDLEALAQWTQAWDEQRYMDYFDSQIQDRVKRRKVRSSMEENIVKIKKLCADMGEHLPFHSFLQLMNRIVFNCYFKLGNSALRIANYYEEILVPADQATRNRMYGYRDGERAAGQLKVHYQGAEVGQLGEQSDMFHLIFDACFHTEDELFDEDDQLFDDNAQASLSNADETVVTLKVWDPRLLEKDPDRFVDLFLFHCSTKLGLNFKRASFEAPLDRRSLPLDDEIQVRPLKAESLPMLYFNSASHNLPPQIVYMSYYHAISYFFERAVNLIIREKMQSMFERDDIEESQSLRRMAKAVNTLRERFSERESLELVLMRTVKLASLKRWLERTPEYQDWYTQTQAPYVELPLLNLASEKELVRSLVSRLYALKATIEEARDKREQFIWIQSLDNGLIQREVPLIKFLAARVIENWSLPVRA